MADSATSPEHTPVARPRKRFARAGEGPASVWNVANLITMVRLALTPLFVVFLLVDGGSHGSLRVWAAVLFIVLIASDFVDGMIARRNNLVTDFGKISDPIADKGLVGSALVGLSVLGELGPWWWVTVVILVRELGITVWRFVSLRDRVIPAGPLGKIKTWAQAIALSLLLVPLQHVVGDWYLWLGWVALALALVLTVVSGLEYVASGVRVTRQEKRATVGAP